MRAAVLTRGLAEGLLLLLFVALPAVFNPLGSEPVDPIKAGILRCLAALIGAAWVSSRLLGAAPLTNMGAHPVVRAALLLLGVTSLSVVLSINPRLSFFGTYFREMGWLTFAAASVVLLAGADLWSEAARRERAVTAVLIGAALPCAYGVLQQLGRDPIPWGELGGPASSFGSPTFFGGYLVVVAAFALYRVAANAQSVAAADAGYRTTLTYAACLVLLLIIATLITLTTIRGPLVGLVSEVLAFALAASLRLPRRMRRLAWMGAGALLGVTLGLSVAVAGGAGVQVLGRFLGSAREGSIYPVSSFLSVSDRLSVWSAALPLPLTEPLRALVGFGPEMQLPVLEHAAGAVLTTPTEGGQWDRAHDLLIDTWLTGGALGVIGLLSVLAVVGRGMWRVARQGGSREALLAAAVLAGLVGHVVEASFAFETVVTSTLLWVLVALGASLMWRPAAAGPTPHPRPTRPHRAAFAGVAMIAAILLLPVLWAPVVADNVFGRATRAERLGAFQTAAQRAEAAAAWAPWFEEMPRTAGLSWQQLGAQRPGQEGELLLARAERQFQEAVRRGPYYPLGNLRLARLYLAWARRSPVTRTPAELLGQAEQACALALQDGPYLPRTWQDCAEISRERGQTGEAAARAERARQLGAQI